MAFRGFYIFGKRIGGSDKKPKAGTIERVVYDVQTKQLKEGWDKNSLKKGLIVGGAALGTVLSAGALSPVLTGVDAGAAGAGVVMNDAVKDKMKQQQDSENQKNELARLASDSQTFGGGAGLLGIGLLFGLGYILLKLFK